MSYNKPLYLVTKYKPKTDPKERLLESLSGFMLQEEREEYMNKLKENRKKGGLC